MKKCPRCGYVDEAAVRAARKYDAANPRDRAAYMREYRAKKRREAAAKAKRKKP
jgi:hypothetical protein